MNWHSREELMQLVVMLSKQGLSRRAIGRSVGISRNTVRALLMAHAAEREAPLVAVAPARRRAPRPSKVDPFKANVAALMTKFPDITSQRVFEILKAEGFGGGYTSIKRHVRAMRPPPKPEPSRVSVEYSAGEMAESDWSPYEICFTTGIKMVVQAFSYVLVFSKRKAFSLYESNDVHALMDGHTQAFDRFGACAATCKYDSQKPVVLRWEGQQPIYNPRFLAFSSHYEFRPLAVRRGHPNDKPRTERSFWEVERSFLNGREFRDLEDMRAQLARWLDEIVDHRRLEKRTALERFAEEREHLVTLPRHAYDTARVIYRVCSIDGFVAWEGNRYAVPYDHVTDLLPVRITQRELFVYAADLRCIARHQLARRGEGLKLDPAGYHPSPRRQTPIDLDQLRQAFESMGERANDFFRLISQRRPRVWAAQARQILLLRERYSTSDLDLALGRAADYGALEIASVERILATRATPRSLDEYVTEDTTRRIEETLGNARTEPRPLTEYDRLPQPKEPPCPSHAEDPTDPNPEQCPTTTSTSNDSNSSSSSSDST